MAGTVQRLINTRAMHGIWRSRILGDFFHFVDFFAAGALSLIFVLTAFLPVLTLREVSLALVLGDDLCAVATREASRETSFFDLLRIYFRLLPPPRLLHFP